MVLGALAIVWIIVLGSYARERMVDRRRDSVSAFRTQLSTLQRTQSGTNPFDRKNHFGAAPMGARMGSASSMQAETARLRRQYILITLLSVALFSVILAVVVTTAITIALAVLAVLAFSGYVALLVERQRVVTEQRAKVRPLASVRTRPAPRTRMSHDTVLVSTSRR